MLKIKTPKDFVKFFRTAQLKNSFTSWLDPLLTLKKLIKRANVIHRNKLNSLWIKILMNKIVITTIILNLISNLIIGQIPLPNQQIVSAKMKMAPRIQTVNHSVRDLTLHLIFKNRNSPFLTISIQNNN